MIEFNRIALAIVALLTTSTAIMWPYMHFAEPWRQAMAAGEASPGWFFAFGLLVVVVATVAASFSAALFSSGTLSITILGKRIT